MRGPSRRRVLTLTGAAALSATPLARALATTAGEGAAPAASPAGPQHAITVFGAPRYGPDFTHFDYANPDAPKGGRIRLGPSSWTTNQNPTTFNTFNMNILKGDSPPLLDITMAGLMVRNFEEPDAVYGLIAESVTVDGRAYAFTLRDGPTFSDGSPITPEDVVFTYETLAKDGHPIYRQLLAGMESVAAEGPRTAVITFREGTSNRLPPLVSVIPILSKAYYTAHSILDANLDIPVGSGAYTIGDFRAGRYVTFVRRADDWMADVPARVGHNNFDEVRVEFYRERLAAFEAFKKGDLTYREEFTSKTWATEYDFPAIRDGRVVRRQFPDDRPAGAQGFFINTRRKKFADPRTRAALGYAFDFEWTNRHVFYGLYERTPSFFVNSDLMAAGEPSAAELALLEPYRGKVPDAVFGTAWLPPESDGSGNDRAPLRQAAALLKEAGWTRDKGSLVNADGEPLTVELMYFQPSWDRILLPFIERLKLLGVAATPRMVESAQYQSRVNAFDFDLVTQRYNISPTPGEQTREIWGSRAAGVEGSFNLAGIADPVVDELTDRMLAATTRPQMLAAAHALDRVLRLGHYWIPQWYNKWHNVAYWDEFGMPESMPRYEFPVATVWWAKDS
ncbi:MAG: extracellular solute-binding protein [Acuticoccus sp.]